MGTIRAVKAACFSPSGGTKRAAGLLCDAFGLPAEFIDCTCPPAALPPDIPVEKDELLVLAFPVYGGFAPRVEGLFRQLRGRGGPCVLLAAYGNRHYDNALAAAARQMTGQGFVCVGALACITPHVFAPKLGAGRPDEADREVLRAFAEHVACKGKMFFRCSGARGAARRRRRAPQAAPCHGPHAGQTALQRLWPLRAGLPHRRAGQADECG